MYVSDRLLIPYFSFICEILSGNSATYCQPPPRAFLVQSSYKLNLPPHLIIPSSSIKLVESIGQGVCILAVLRYGDYVTLLCLDDCSKFLLAYVLGEFGLVYKGHFVKETNTEVVAIKTLKGLLIKHDTEMCIHNDGYVIGFYDRSMVRDMLKECSKMHNFSHPNVLTLIGVCLDGGPTPYIIMPFMANGSLLSYLKKNRGTLVVSRKDENDEEVSVNCIGQCDGILKPWCQHLFLYG